MSRRFGLAGGAVCSVLLAGALLAPGARAVGAPAGTVTGSVTDSGLRTSTATWDVAAARLGTAGSLWEPHRTLGLERTRRITVIGDGITVANGAVTGGVTFAGTRYGRGARSVWLAQKWADTGWAAEPAVSTSRALVRTVRLALGPRGMRILVPARVYADCIEQPVDRDPRPVPARARCSRADVLRYGGTVEFTARPSSTMTAPGNTTVVLQSRGLTYSQLLRVAGSLEQVAGAPAGGAGSAQMIGMCAQMVRAPMTPTAAEEFAVANGYTLRVGSVDGVARPLTADYRPDRFTVTVVADAITGCTYG